MSKACHSYTPLRVPLAIYACLLWNVHTYRPAQSKTQMNETSTFVIKKMREKKKEGRRKKSLREIPKPGDNEILIRSPID